MKNRPLACALALLLCSMSFSTYAFGVEPKNPTLNRAESDSGAVQEIPRDSGTLPSHNGSVRDSGVPSGRSVTIQYDQDKMTILDSGLTSYLYCYDRPSEAPFDGAEYAEGVPFEGQLDHNGADHQAQADAIRSLLYAGFPFDGYSYSEILKNTVSPDDPEIQAAATEGAERAAKDTYRTALQNMTGSSSPYLSELEALATDAQKQEAKQQAEQAYTQTKAEIIQYLVSYHSQEGMAYHLTQQALWITLGQMTREEITATGSQLEYLHLLLDAAQAELPQPDNLTLSEESLLFSWQEETQDYRTPILYGKGFMGKFTLLLPQGIEMVDLFGNPIKNATTMTAVGFSLRSRQAPVDEVIEANPYTFLRPDQILLYRPISDPVNKDTMQHLIGYTATKDKLDAKFPVDVQEKSPDPEPEPDPKPDPDPDPNPDPDPVPPNQGGGGSDGGDSDDRPTTTIPDSPVPLGDGSEELVTILEEEVPLGRLPQSGSNRLSHLLGLGGILLLLGKIRQIG